MVDEWAKRNRDRINARRRALRTLKRQQAMKDKRCLNCTIFMAERCKGVRLYCESCVKNYPEEVRRHRWRRYWHRKTCVQRALQKAW